MPINQRTDSAGAGIRVLRQRAGLTLDEMAALMGASASYVSRVETGTARASNAWLGNAANVLGSHLSSVHDSESVGAA